jgi:hypothetical protein
MKIRSIASALLLVALVLCSCTQQNTEVNVGSSRSTSADTDVKTNSWSSTLSPSKLFLFTRNGKYGYIDRTGKIVIPAKFEEAKNFSEGLATVKLGGKFGCIDETGKLVIPARFDSIDNFENGIAVASSKNVSGTLDRAGNFTPYNENSNSATPDRDELISFSEEDISANITYEFAYKLGLYGPKPRGRDDYLHGYKDRRTGKVIIRPQFRNAADRFSEGLAWIMDERGRVGYIDKQGKIVIPPQYSYSRELTNASTIFTEYFGSDFNGGLAKVCSKGKSSCGYIDRTGKVVIPLKFDEVAEKFSNGLAWVVINDRRGYIDTTGKIVIPLQSYSSVGDFYDGLARVCNDRNDKCGYIDRPGKIVIPLKFDEVAKKFSNGLAWVVINERLGYIDKTGKVKIPAKFKTQVQSVVCDRKCFDGHHNFDRGLAAVKIPKTCGSSNGNDCDRYGYIDTTGKLVFEF